jgi:multiple sugar transport system permease protein
MRALPKDRLALVVILVSLVFYSIMVWYPIIDEFLLSLAKGLVMKRTYIGLDNYRQLAQDADVRNAIGVTIRYTLMVVPTTTILGLVLASIVNSIHNLLARTLIVCLFFFPNLIPLTASASFWKFLMAPTDSGVINSFLALVGIGPIKFLETVATALPSLAFVSIWGAMGYVMVLMLGGMQGIPTVFYEAAAIDGANAWRRFRHITVPLLMPTITFVVVLLTFGALMMLEPVYVMTGGAVSHDPKGGPAGSTTTVVYLIYTQAFMNFKQGYAAAIAVVWFFVILAVGLVQFRLMSRSSKYEY